MVQNATKKKRSFTASKSSSQDLSLAKSLALRAARWADGVEAVPDKVDTGAAASAGAGGGGGVDPTFMHVNMEETVSASLSASFSCFFSLLA